MWLNADGISWPANVKRPNALQDSWLGPFNVVKGNEGPNNDGNITLDLPPSLSRVEPVIHISKLEPFIENDPLEFPDRSQQAPPTALNDDGNLIAEVESILDHKWERGQVWYLIKYLGYPASEAEWHSYSAEDESWNADRALVVEYQKSHPPPCRPPRRISRKIQLAKDRASAAKPASNIPDKRTLRSRSVQFG